MPFRHLSSGVLAQLGERNAGSVEVRGSIPLDSTTLFSSLSLFFPVFPRRLHKRLALALEQAEILAEFGEGEVVEQKCLFAIAAFHLRDLGQ